MNDESTCRSAGIADAFQHDRLTPAFRRQIHGPLSGGEATLLHGQ
jgi:hypothetical protein